jgi:tetratricopeptide (TPR) repeat protein
MLLLSGNETAADNLAELLKIKEMAERKFPDETEILERQIAYKQKVDRASSTETVVPAQCGSNEVFLADRYAQQGEQQKAEALYRQCLANDDTRMYAAAKLGDLLRVNNRLDEAEVIERICGRPGTDEVFSFLGSIYRFKLLKDLDRTETLMQKSHALLAKLSDATLSVKGGKFVELNGEEKNLDDRILRAENFAKLELYEEAIDQCNKAISKSPNYLRAYKLRGYYLYDIDRYKAAIADFNKIVDVDSRDISALDTRAQCNKLLKRWQNAKDDFETLRRLQHGNLSSDTWYDFARTNYYLENYRDALAEVTQSIKLDPTNACAWNAKGIYEERLGQHPQDLADFEKAILLEPKHRDHFKCLSEAYDRIGETAKADAVRRKAAAVASD